MRNELFFATDENLIITSWSDEIAAYTGKPSDIALGNKYHQIIPPILADGKDALAEVVRTRRPISIRDHHINCLFAHINANIAIRPSRPLNGMTANCLDVVIQPASICAAQHKLLQAEKLINIGKIASTLAHGIRNPLNAIKGAVVYLGEKYSSEAPLVEFTKIMEEEIHHLEDFIAKFLSSSVLDTEATESDINALLKKIEVLTSLQFYTRNIQSVYEFGDIPPVTINTFHLEQAILNVINNALDAMNSGGRLRISTSTGKRSGRPFVVITIADSGPGLRKKNPVELPTGKNENGRGFGLFITYEILKHYNGHLEIESQDNKGTTISLFIPSGTAQGTVL